VQLSAQKRQAFEKWQQRRQAMHLPPQHPTPLQAIMLAEAAHSTVAAQLAHKALCKATRQAAKHDRTQHLLSKAQAMEEAMPSGRLQQAFGIAAELRGGGRAPRVEAIREGTAIAYGDKVEPALAHHFHATFNVDTAVAPELLAAMGGVFASVGQPEPPPST